MNRESGSNPPPDVQVLLSQISELEQKQTEGADRLRQLRLKLRELEGRRPAASDAGRDWQAG
jgi:hypothetical protein